MAIRLPPYSHFQSAFIDPALQVAPNASKGSPKLFHESIESLNMKVVVGPAIPSQRTWRLPKELLSQHSTYLRAACKDPSVTCMNLPSIVPSAFQNFIDFMHSNIYSLHKQAPDYHRVLSHAQAWVLGDKLEAKVFRDAALCALHNEIEPLARDVYSRAMLSPIRAADVEYVCTNTDIGSTLRAMLFDAIASHWTQLEVLNFGYSVSAEEFGDGSTTTWMDVYNRHADFRARLANSLKVSDVLRCGLLRPVGDYLAGKVDMKEEEELVEGGGGDLRGEKTSKRVGLVIRQLSSRLQESVMGSESRLEAPISTESISRDSVGGEDEDEDWMMADDP